MIPKSLSIWSGHHRRSVVEASEVVRGSNGCGVHVSVGGASVRELLVGGAFAIRSILIGVQCLDRFSFLVQGQSQQRKSLLVGRLTRENVFLANAAAILSVFCSIQCLYLELGLGEICHYQR